MYQTLLKQSLLKQQDVETRSLSSHDSFRQKHAIIVKDLYNNVSKQLKKNEQKLLQIIKDNPHYNFDLYRPSMLSRGQSKQNLNSELLEKQLDRLMEDQCSLDKQLSKIQFINQQDQLLKQIQTNQHIDHFSFLRNIWHKSNKQEYTHSEDRIQQLNRKVVMVKGSIKRLKQKEKQNNPESEQLQKYIQQSKQFLQFKHKYQRLVEQCKNKQQSYNNQIYQLESKIQQLKQDNNNISRRFSEQVEKIKKKDDQILKIMHKYQILELECFKKQKQLKKINQNVPINDQSIKLNKNFININPETNKKLIYSNKNQGFSLHIVLQSDSISPQLSNLTDNILSTTKTLNEIKSYLSSNNSLQGLIQNKYVTIIPAIHSASLSNSISATYLKSDLSNTLEKKKDNRRISNFERPQTLRSQNILGSADKRKRFERTKLIENEAST